MPGDRDLKPKSLIGVLSLVAEAATIGGDISFVEQASKLDFSGLCLGSVPDALRKLDHLTELDLSDNPHLHGLLPDCLNIW